MLAALQAANRVAITRPENVKLANWRASSLCEKSMQRIFEGPRNPLQGRLFAGTIHSDVYQTQ